MSFAADIDRFVKKYQISAETVATKVATDMSAEIIDRTPVKTGRAAGNWLASLDSPASGGGGLSGAAAKSAAAATAGGAYGHVYYLVNNLPYIRNLEYGSSKQAPQGMVRITVRRYQAYIRAALKK